MFISSACSVLVGCEDVPARTRVRRTASWTHAFAYRGSFESPVCLLLRFGKLEGKQRTLRKQTLTWDRDRSCRAARKLFTLRGKGVILEFLFLICRNNREGTSNVMKHNGLRWGLSKGVLSRWGKAFGNLTSGLDCLFVFVYASCQSFYRRSTPSYLMHIKIPVKSLETHSLIRRADVISTEMTESRAAPPPSLNSQ